MSCTLEANQGVVSSLNPPPRISLSLRDKTASCVSPAASSSTRPRRRKMRKRRRCLWRRNRRSGTRTFLASLSSVCWLSMLEWWLIALGIISAGINGAITPSSLGNFSVFLLCHSTRFCRALTSGQDSSLPWAVSRLLSSLPRYLRFSRR